MLPRSWRRVVCIDGAILTSWLACAGMAILHEHGQLWGGFGNPTTSLNASMEANEQWFGIYFQGEKIGFSTITLTPEEQRGMPGVALLDRGRLSFNLLGEPQELEITAKAFIDANWRLQTFTAAIHASNYRLTWTGQRQGEELLVTVATPEHAVTKRLKDPTGSAFVNGLSSWAAFHRLHVGQYGKAWVLNPLALSPEAVYFHVRGSGSLEGKPVLVVESDVAGMTTTSWVTAEGEVLKETSPLGWELRRESKEVAWRTPAQHSARLDLLSSTSVPVDVPISEPGRVDHLTLLVEGVTCDEISIQRPWQTSLPAERLAAFHRQPPQGPWCLVQLDRPSAAALQAIPETRTVAPRYREPSLFVQSRDSRILAKAKAIIGPLTDPWQQVGALNRWVFTSLRKRLTVGLPSAVDILTSLAGDCHEHTVLFTALARSLGIPTRMVAGLVYWQDRFYYHAWPEVWLGTWVPTDPTLGQVLADPTHLGLIEAENESLIALGQFVGKPRIQVVAVESPETVPAPASVTPP